MDRRNRRVFLVYLGIAILSAVTFSLGTWFGYAVSTHRQAAGQASTAPGPATQQLPATSEAPAQTLVPRACFDTARLADQIIDLLVANRRGRELDTMLRSYGATSQQCQAAEGG